MSGWSGELFVRMEHNRARNGRGKAAVRRIASAVQVAAADRSHKEPNTELGEPSDSLGRLTRVARGAVVEAEAGVVAEAVAVARNKEYIDDGQARGHLLTAVG